MSGAEQKSTSRSLAGPRCIAIVGPFQSGKTTLLEAILERTGALQRAGQVTDGNTVGDSSAGGPRPLPWRRAEHRHRRPSSTTA